MVSYAQAMGPKLAVTPAGRQTREALLDAGTAVAERHGLSGLSVNRVVAEAALAKGTFYVHFDGRAAFVDALHERFYAQVADAVRAATQPLEPGLERLMRGAEVYLDACLDNRAVKALLLEARADGTLTRPMADRQAGFADLAAASLRAIGWRDAAVAAPMFVAAISEAAILELEAGKRLPSARRTLQRMLERESR